MINKTADFFENLAKAMGLSVKIPRFGRSSKIASMIMNGLAGSLFITIGLVYRKVWLVLLGMIGIAGVIILVADSREDGI